MSKLLLGIAIAMPLIGALIRILNVRHLRAKSQLVPPGFESVVDSGTLKKMAEYATQTGQLAIFHDLTAHALIIAALFGGFFGRFDGWISGLPLSPTLQGMLLFILLSWAFAILSLPFGIYGDFVVEQRHGFNRSTKMLFFMDFIKGQLVTSIFMAVVAAVALAIIKWSNHNWWFWVWLFLLVFQILLTLIAPRWLEPLFIKVKPLVNEALDQEIRAMAARASVRVDRVFQVDASRRSSHTNAYFSGFGPVKRVVLYDTLLDKLNPDEILGVVAHELGHWRLRHVLKSLGLFQAVALVACFVAYQLINWGGLTALFGLGQTSVFGRAVLIFFLASLMSFGLTPLFNAVSRKHEWEADAFACEFVAPNALANGLSKLVRDNLSNLHPHPLYAAFYGSHPPTVDRVNRLRLRHARVPSHLCSKEISGQ